jgi:DNA primase
LYTVLDACAKFYQRELGKSGKANAYFHARGLDAATIERFGLGYAPDGWDGVKSALGTTPQRIALLEKGGMLTRGERGTPYDRFRDRVMFPIQDRRGRVIAFGGRILEKTEDSGAKYLNSPETPLFHKGQQLFALWQVRQAHSKIPRLIVVEGYMDVIALFQHGVTQAVATLGTATTRDHAELLFRNCADVYFCFDGDRAGRSAAWKAVESVLPRMRDGRQAFFLFLPEGEDPDSLVRKEGQAGFEQRLRDAMPLSEFFFAELGKETNLNTRDGQARLVERSRPLIAQIPDGAFRDQMESLLTETTTTQWSGNEIYKDLRKLIRQDAVEAAKGRIPRDYLMVDPRRLINSTTHNTDGARNTLVRAAVGLLVQNPSFAESLQPPWLFAALRQPGIALLAELIALCRERPTMSTAVLLEHYEGREEARALQKLATLDFPGEDDLLRAEFVDAIRQLDRQTHQQRLDDLLKKQGEAALDADEKDELRRLLAAKNAPRPRESQN